MKNRKLKNLLLDLKIKESSTIQVLSIAQELSILGGSCPMLTQCDTYVSCEVKYKVIGGDTGTVNSGIDIEL